MPPRSWTDDMDDKLRQMCAAGKTATQMLQEFWVEDRIKVSRNSVIGRKHRLGLSNGRKPGGFPGNAGNTTNPPRKNKTILWGARAPKLSKPLSAAPAQPARPSVIDPATQVSIFDHVEGQCRWPITEILPISDFRYCGGPVCHDRNGEPRVYCAPHWRMSQARYQPAAEAA